MKLARSIVLVILACACASISIAQNFTTSQFHSLIEVKPDRTLRIREMINVDFSRPSHGILRYIPVEYNSKQGFVRQVGLRVIDVTQQVQSQGLSAIKATYTVLTNGKWKEIRIGDRNISFEGRVRYVIEYEINGALTDFEATENSKAHTELLWHVIPTGWATPIEDAQATIKFPKGGSSPPRVRFLVGKIGAKDNVEIVAPGKEPIGRTEMLDVVLQDGETAVRAKYPLGDHEGIQIALAFAKGGVKWEGAYVPKPNPAGTNTQTSADQTPVGSTEPQSPGPENLWSPMGLIPFGIMAGLALLFKKVLGLPKQGPLVTRFEPPSGVGPMEAGYMYDVSFEPRDLTAGLLSLAQKGAIRLHLPDPEKSSTKSYTIEVLDAKPTQPLTTAEQRLLDGLVEHGPIIEPSSLSGSFRFAYENVQRAVQSEAMYNRWLRPNQGCVQGFGCLSTVFLAVILASFCSQFGLGFTILGTFAGVLLLCAVFLTSKSYTTEGAKIQHELKGLHEFISRAQKSSLEEMSMKMPLQVLFESLLPYAVAFGYAKTWTQAFHGLSISAPSWLDTGPSYSYDTYVWTDSFSSSLTTFENEWTPAMTPPSLFENLGSSNNDRGSTGGDTFASGGSSFSDYGSSSDSSSSSFDFGSSDSGSVGDGGGGGGGDSW